MAQLSRSLEFAIQVVCSVSTRGWCRQKPPGDTKMFKGVWREAEDWSQNWREVGVWPQHRWDVGGGLS